MREYARRLSSPASDVDVSVSPSLRGGQPLDARTRLAFESRFAHDFTNVRVHTGAAADAAARSADALAYAVGPHVVFRHGLYAPHTSDGRKLLAHELAHVVHADGAMHRKPASGTGDDPAEERADMAADQAMAGPPQKEETEKDPVNPAVPLPAARADSKVLSKGTMTWDLHAVDHSHARIDLDFRPDPDKVDAKNISFVQTVVNTLGRKMLYPGASLTDTVGKKAEYSPYEATKNKRRVDHGAGTENDPFYGAEWDNSSTPQKWKNEDGGTVVGRSNMARAQFADSLTPTSWTGTMLKQMLRSSAATSARLNDNPGTAMGRLGKGATTKQFETVPVVLETREPLGAIQWGYKIGDAPNAPLELTGGTKADVTDAPSAGWGAALDKFYKAKFEILDTFDQDKSDLKPAHKATLDRIVTRMKANASLTAELGGAADLKDADPSAIAQSRADAARDYLVSKGIDAGRLTTQAYGSDWARAATSAGAAEPKNRRVQIWVK